MENWKSVENKKFNSIQFNFNSFHIFATNFSFSHHLAWSKMFEEKSLQFECEKRISAYVFKSYMNYERCQNIYYSLEHHWIECWKPIVLFRCSFFFFFFSFSSHFFLFVSRIPIRVKKVTKLWQRSTINWYLYKDPFPRQIYEVN